MADITAAIVPPALLQPAAPATGAELAKRGRIRETAEKFETQFLSIMLQQMFQGVETSAPFGGGPGETMFRSVMTEALAKQMVRSGGIGVTDAVTTEMLKLPGLR